MTNKITKCLTRGLVSLSLASALTGCNPGENYSTNGWIKLDNGEQVRTSGNEFWSGEIKLQVKRDDGTQITYKTDSKLTSRSPDYLTDIKITKINVQSRDKEVYFESGYPMYSNAVEIARQQYTNYLSQIQQEKSQRALNSISGERK